ncbi:vesicle transport v-SNARE 11 [Artemisia annua]|uniref:Vesicle transport v-SNARE 11 n=1 Tax=Artemisia annua TaxID=35608 RepID=A0A2U1L991_ARTAN|nr:vesicle transport v-SNARE 11 [Artemisia annua]
MAMSEVFKENDRKLRELLANLAPKCTSARLLLEEEKKVRVCEIAREIDEAEGLIRKMELEARSLKKKVKAKVVVKLGEYGNDVKKLKNELAKLRSGSATQATVGNIHTMQGYSDQRGRLVTSIDSVKKSSDRIGECREDMRRSGLTAIILTHQRLREYLLQGNTTVRSSC